MKVRLAATRCLTILKRDRRQRETATSPRERGQSLVEFALCMPLMLLLLLGTLDFGQVFFEYMQMRDAAREGAVFAARYTRDGVPSYTTAVRQSTGVDGLLDNDDTGVVVESCTVDGVCTEATDSLPSMTYDSGYSVKVTVNRTFRPTILSFFERIGIDEIHLSASSSAKVWT